MSVATTYTFDNLKEDVRKEAEALRVHATKEERERLDIETMIPYHCKKDIYGQMTGEFDSARATELKQKCAAVFVDGDVQDFKAIGIHECFTDFSWSPIEYYELCAEAKNANLIAYLRGETETLEL
jgi:hypothetical protein